MLALLAKLQFKNDSRLIVFAIVLVLATAAGVYGKYISPKEGMIFLAGALALPGLFGRKDDDKTDPPVPPPPKLPFIGGSLLSIIGAALLFVGAACLVADPMIEPPITSVVTGCSLTRQEAKDVTKKALSVLDLACIFASSIVDEGALAKACGIADDLTPLLRELVGQREAARKAGVTWRGSDGGPAPPAASSP